MARIVTNGRTRRRANEDPRDKTIRTVSIAVVAVCAALAAWRLLAPTGRSVPTPQERDTPKERERPARIAGNGKATPEELDTPSKNEGTVSAGRDGHNAPQEREESAAEQNDTKTKERDANVAKPKAAEPVVPGNRERQFFDNDIENTIASVSEPGAEFFGFPPIDNDMEDSEIIAILKRPVEITEDDDEAAIAAKERTAEFKAKALEAMENGLTFAQFVRDLVALRNEQAAMREDAYQETIKILRKEGEPAAREYMKSVNDELKAQGLKEIVLSPIVLEGIREESGR